jgi:riboflavin kinase
MRIRGKVVSGIGEASWYVEKYSETLKTHLGEKPYPGTLNILLCECFNELLKGVKPIVINPPEQGLCSALGYIGYVKGFKVLVLKPLASRHDCRVVELIAGVKLRDVLGLRDGDEIEVDVISSS